MCDDVWTLLHIAFATLSLFLCHSCQQFLMQVSFALANMCGSDLKRYEEATALFNVLDVNKRGKVTWDEFNEAVSVARQQQE